MNPNPDGRGLSTQTCRCLVVSMSALIDCLCLQLEEIRDGEAQAEHLRAMVVRSRSIDCTASYRLGVEDSPRVVAAQQRPPAAVGGRQPRRGRPGGDAAAAAAAAAQAQAARVARGLARGQPQQEPEPEPEPVPGLVPAPNLFRCGAYMHSSS